MSNTKKIQSACIIDDDPIFIYGVKLIMKKMDFCDTVLVFQNGEEAFNGLTALLKSGNDMPNVIFLDINMPIMNGWEFLDSFLQTPNNSKHVTTIYIVSSSIDPRDIERCYTYKEVNNYLLKPLAQQDLEKVIQNYAQDQIPN